MNEEKVNEIIDDITDDSSLCIIRNALENFEEEKVISSADIETFTDDELKQEYEIVRRELENRNIEQSLPVLWNC